MTGLNICRGCFSEMMQDQTTCPKCGWHPLVKYVDGFYWQLGEVIEKRYLMGCVFYVSGAKGVVVFRIYDNMLKTPLFLLLARDNTEESYQRIARSLETSKWSAEGRLRVLSLKKVKGEECVIFSLKDLFEDDQAFEECLERAFNDMGDDSSDESSITSSDVGITVPQTQNREDALKIGYVLAERYEVVSYLGIGGFGITYLCKDLKLEKYVAVKEYFPQDWAQREEGFVSLRRSGFMSAYQYGMKAFADEIGVTAKFIHTPHVVTVLDAVSENDTLYMVMEYLSGVSLGKYMRLREFTPLPEDEVKVIAAQILDALASIHERQIIHSDISPGNLLQCQSGEVSIIDMGAAKNPSSARQNMHTVFLKTEFASPEQYLTAKHKRPAGEGPWTDLYALGATLYYLLTGEKPFDVIARIDKGMEHEDYIWEKIPDKWTEFLKKATEMEIHKRFHSAAEMKEALSML